MKEKIEQLAKGKFEYCLPQLILSEERLNIRVPAGKDYHGEFSVSNSKGRSMKGVVYADHALLTLEKKQFIGEEAVIPYVFHTAYAKAGDRLNGTIDIVTDAGEEELPFEVQIVFPYMETSIGEVKDLYQFTTLAKENPVEAEELFFSEQFANTMFYHDKKYELMYKTLAESGKKGQATEEFLIATGKKMAVELNLEQSEYQYTASGYNFMDKLVLIKNGWGYIGGTITCDADFVELSVNSFSADSFQNNRVEIGFVVKASGLKAGIHYATIRIHTAKQTLEARICCKSGAINSEKRRFNLRKAQVWAGLMENFIAFSCGGKNSKQYIQEEERLATAFRQEEADERTQLLMRLVQLHVWEMSGKDSAVKNSLGLLSDPMKLCEIEKDPDTEAAFCYLKALININSTEQKEIERVESLYAEFADNQRILWYFLHLSKTYNNSEKRFDLLSSRQDRVYSPLVLTEGAFALRENPSLLKKFGRFELCVLIFAAKHRFISDELYQQIIFAAGREKNMSQLLYVMLTYVYRMRESKELLEVICSLIIRSGKKEQRYFCWLKKGVEQQLRVAELEEYYLYCMDETFREEIPQQVYLYYSYHSDMNASKKAVLYANMIRNRAQAPGVYQKYYRNMELFAGEQICRGAINENMALIYNEVYASEMNNAEELLHLAEVAFAWKITCQLPFIKAVCAIHPGDREIVPIAFRDGVAYVDICSEKAELFLVDSDGCFYPYANLAKNPRMANALAKEKLLMLDSHLWRSYLQGARNYRLMLRLREEAVEYQKHDEYLVELYSALSEMPELTDLQKNVCYRYLVDHYYEDGESALFENYLSKLMLEPLTQRERGKIINHLISRDFMTDAVSALRKFGFAETDIRRLSRLVEFLLPGADGTDEFLTKLIFYVFESGKSTGEMIEYLCKYYHGATAKMNEIWKAARKEEIDTELFEESLLGQMFFAETYAENAAAIFFSYYRSGTNRKLIRAFLNYYAYKYLLRGRVIAEELFEVMERECSLESNDLCVMALLKHYSEEELLSDRKKQFIGYKLHHLMEKGIYLPFFRKFEGVIRLPEEYYDQYFVEYCADPEEEVTIHFMLDGNDEFREQKMKNVFYGIFVVGFTLFEGESLQYYITEGSGANSVITESTTIVCVNQPEGYNHYYDNINLMLVAQRMHDETTLLKLMEQQILMKKQAEIAFRGLFRDAK